MASNPNDVLKAVKTWANSVFQPKGDYLTEISAATEESIGGVIIDGVTITINENGVISANSGIGESVSVSITENADNDENTYKLDISVGDESFTTPNLMGENGQTPYIGENGNWFISDTDTGVSAAGGSGSISISEEEGNVLKEKEDGLYVPSPTVNISQEEGNIIEEKEDGLYASVEAVGSALPTGGTTGQILTKASNADGDAIWKSLNAQADFLTEEGFGNLRYYNGKFEYKTASGEWVETAATPDNVLVVNMMPNTMQRIIGIYDHEVGKNKLKWLEPEDTVVDGQVICLVEKVVIRRKLGSAPLNENDGDLVLTVECKDFNQHDAEWWFDEGVTPTLGDVWHYKAFPIATTGFANGSSMNECALTAKDHYLFGFKIDQNESDPMSMLTYIEDNINFRSSYMNYTQDKFNYGDWEDFWFIKDVFPCMLSYDGTVAYELDKNDQTKKKDGTPSDVANADFSGNAMVAIPKTYWKVVDNGDDTENIYFSDKKIDDDFVCWSHIDNNGNEIPYCYMPMYPGSLVNNVLRNLSGKTPISSKTAQQEITYALANNLTSDVIWYTEVFCDRILIGLLLLLIGKSTDTQTVFGSGNNNSYVSTSNTGVKTTGNLNGKGMFWGNTDNKTGVVVFFMQHYYGQQWNRIAGQINNKGTQKIKMTYGQSDGSTVDGYNLDGSGYIVIPDATPTGTSGGYISKMLFTEHGMIPKQASGSATTYYTDGLWFNNSQVDYALVGGHSGNGLRVGASCAGLDGAASAANWGHGAALSCKPLA